MDFLDELERMAQMAIQETASGIDETPSDNDVKRWQTLFGYSWLDAVKKIQDHRSDLCRFIVSKGHWEMVQVEKEAQGYNKEAYEYSCQLGNTNKPSQPKLAKSTPATYYLLKFERSFTNLEAVQTAGELTALPSKLTGTDNDGKPADFCKVDSGTKERIIDFCPNWNLGFSLPSYIIRKQRRPFRPRLRIRLLASMLLCLSIA